MIRVPQSPTMAGVALIAAFGLHAAYPMLMMDGPNAQIAGGNTELAAQGNAFADMVSGIMAPEPPQDAQKSDPDATETLEPVETPPVTQPVTPPVARAPLPTPTVTAQQPVATPAQAVTTPVAEAPTVAVAKRPEPVEPPEPTPVQPTPIAPTPPQPVEQTPNEVTEVEQPQEQPEPQEPEEVQEPQEPTEQAPRTSLRPPERPEPKPVEVTPPKPTQVTPPKPQPRGNSNANAVQGTAQGRQQQSAGQAATTAGNATAQGNAAASNYPGQVLRRVQRAKRGSANVRGTAVVAFRVASNGSLAGVSIAKSSGSAKLDQLAIQQVRRAAPFPPPPAGARTSFSVRIKGK